MHDFKRQGNPRFGDRRDAGKPRGPMYPAVCATCGKPTEVPFRPDGSRPIYCREHLGNQTAGAAPARERSFDRPSYDRPAPRPFRQDDHREFRNPPAPSRPAPDARIDSVLSQLAKLTTKMDQLLLEIAVAKAQADAETTAPAIPAKAKKAPAKAKAISKKR